MSLTVGDVAEALVDILLIIIYTIVIKILTISALKCADVVLLIRERVIPLTFMHES